MRGLAAALAAVTLIRLVVAATAPLAPDETYYWVWSHALAPGYLDHPPMVALWIRAGTALLGQNALGVRLFGPLAAAAASVMLVDAGRVLFPWQRGVVGVVAALLLNATLLLGVGTVIMTPDSPQLFFWTATLWAMARIAALSEAGTEDGAGWWLLAGLAGGLALDSKYTALLLWIGAVLWLLWVPAAWPWARRWQLWAAGAIGVLLFAPVIAWNAMHAWAGMLKQGGRVEDWQPSRAAGFLAELLGSQIGLATPLVFGLCMVGFAKAFRHTLRWRDPAWSLLAALSLPSILVFVQHAFGGRVQGNWPAIMYPALALAAGGAGFAPRWWIGASGLGFAMTVLVYVQAMTGVVPLPPRFDPIALRLTGWDSLALDVSGYAAGSGFVAVDGYSVASELAWWMPPGTAVVGTGDRWALTTLPQAHVAGMTGLLVRDARRADPPDPALWTDAHPVGAAIRSDAPGGQFVVYQVTAVAATNFYALPGRR